jgi:hypothetical protein
LRHQKTKKYIDFIFLKTFSFIVHLEFLNNMHRCMKGIDAKGAIC